MSVVVATREYILADRRITQDGKICQPRIKIARNAHMLAGTVGNWMCILAVQALMREGADHPNDLMDALDEDSEALCVMRKKIYVIQADKVGICPRPFYALGTGAHAALGFIIGSKTCNPAGIRAAMRFSFTLNQDCGDGINLLKPAS